MGKSYNFRPEDVQDVVQALYGEWLAYMNAMGIPETAQADQDKAVTKLARLALMRVRAALEKNMPAESTFEQIRELVRAGVAVEIRDVLGGFKVTHRNRNYTYRPGADAEAS